MEDCLLPFLKTDFFNECSSNGSITLLSVCLPYTQELWIDVFDVAQTLAPTLMFFDCVLNYPAPLISPLSDPFSLMPLPTPLAYAFLNCPLPYLFPTMPVLDAYTADVRRWIHMF